MNTLLNGTVHQEPGRADKRDAIKDPEFRDLYHGYDAGLDWSPDDPRLSALADRTQASI